MSKSQNEANAKKNSMNSCFHELMNLNRLDRADKECVNMQFLYLVWKYFDNALHLIQEKH